MKQDVFEDIGSSPKEYKEAMLFLEIIEDVKHGDKPTFCKQHDRIIAKTITEIVDLQAIKVYARNITRKEQNSWYIKKRQQSIWSYIHYVEENGEDYNGLKKNEVKYYRKNGIGRRFAKGPSMQFMSREVRTLAFQNISFDVDMVNAWFSILSAEIRKENASDKYPFISMYSSNPFIWKIVMSEYYDETIEESKLRLIQTLYGMLPSDDNPYLWQLQSEVVSAANFLLSLEKNKYLQNMFEDRKIAIFSRLLTLIIIEEDNLLSILETFLLKRFPTANISLLQYDGLQLFINPEMLKDVEKAIVDYESETGIPIIIKKLDKNPLFEYRDRVFT